MYKSKIIEQSMFYNASPDIFEKARELRKNMTPAETRLWEILRFKNEDVLNDVIKVINIIISFAKINASTSPKGEVVEVH